MSSRCGICHKSKELQDFTRRHKIYKSCNRCSDKFVIKRLISKKNNVMEPTSETEVEQHVNDTTDDDTAVGLDKEVQDYENCHNDDNQGLQELKKYYL